MRDKSILFFLLALLLLLIAKSLFAQNNSPVSIFKFLSSFKNVSFSEPPKNETEKPKFALLIGVSDYKNQSIPKLPGAKNDVANMKELLISDFRFAEKNIVVLDTLESTRKAAIEEGVKDLIEKAKNYKNEKPVVVFYFSGHGSQTRNKDSDAFDRETNKYDETIVSSDSRTDGVFDIPDDQIYDWISEISKYTENITLIFDSCYSGDISKGDKYISKLIGADARDFPQYNRKNNIPEQEVEKKFVTLSAADEDSTAKENSNSSYGVFTKYLIQTLKFATRQRLTFEKITYRIIESVHREASQTPQISGDASRLSNSLLGEVNCCDFYFKPVSVTNSEGKIQKNVSQQIDEGRITFDGGRIYGITEGTRIAIYSSDETSFADDRRILAKGVVDEVGGLNATAKIDFENYPQAKGKLNEKSRIIVISPGYGKPLEVDLTSAGKQLQAEVKQHLDANNLISGNLVRLVESSNKVKSQKTQSVSGKTSAIIKSDSAAAVFKDTPLLLVLKKDRFNNLFKKDPIKYAKQPNICEDKKLPENNPEVFYIDAGDGKPLFGFYVLPDEPLLAEEIARRIHAFAWRKNLLTIKNSISDIEGDSEFNINNSDARFSVLIKKRKRPVTETCDDQYLDEKGGGSGSEIKEPVIEFFPSKDTLELLQRYEIKIQKKSNAGRFFVSAVLVGANGEVSWEESYKDNVWEKYAELNKAGDFAAVTAYTTTPVGTDYWIFYITTEKPDFSFLEFITSEEDKPKGSCNNMESELFNGKLSGCKSKGLKEWMVIAIPITVTDRIANGGKSPLFNSK